MNVKIGNKLMLSQQIVIFYFAISSAWRLIYEYCTYFVPKYEQSNWDKGGCSWEYLFQPGLTGLEIDLLAKLSDIYHMFGL